MVREVKLIEYLPLFIQTYREIEQIMKSENPEFQLICDESEKIKDNQFIQTCDLNGIKRFESLLNITTSPNDTLESRISRVLVRWNDVVPYTWKVFIQKLNSLCDGNFSVISNFDKYEITITTHLDLYGQLDELYKLIDDIVPANILIKIKNEPNYEIKGDVYIPMAMSFTEMLELK